MILPKQATWGSVTILLLICSAVSSQEVLTAEKVLADAPPQWERAIDFVGRIQGKLTKTKRFIRKPSPTAPDVVTLDRMIVLNPRCTLIQVRTVEGSDTEQLAFGVNQKYDFLIKRKDDQSSWVVSHFQMEGNGSRFPASSGKPLRDGVADSICFHFQIVDNRLSLANLVKRKNFRILKVSPIDRDGRSLVQVEFDLTYPLNPKSLNDPNFHPVQGGTLILDPEHYWCMKEYEVRCVYMGATGTCRTRFDYREGPDRFPLLTRAVDNQITQESGTEYESETVYDFQFREVNSMPDDIEFTLTAFGLPEPAGITWHRPRRYLWWVGGAIGLGMCSILLYWLSLKRRRTSAG